jgi:NTE family protein
MRKRVGLALGGGIVRGMAHIGVLSALERAAIPIDYVIGSSVGSLVGGFYCSGIGIERIRELALRVRWWHLLSLAWPAQGLFSFSKLERWIVDQIGDLSFDQLAIPLAVVAADIEQRSLVLINSGKLAPAIHASCAIPGLFKLVEINDRFYGDGAMVNSMPVTIARQMGMDYVIGVDLFTSPIHKNWGFIGVGLAGLETLLQHSGNECPTADCLIAPSFPITSYVRFAQAASLIALGESAALEKINLILNESTSPLREETTGVNAVD